MSSDVQEARWRHIRRESPDGRRYKRLARKPISSDDEEKLLANTFGKQSFFKFRSFFPPRNTLSSPGNLGQEAVPSRPRTRVGRSLVQTYPRTYGVGIADTQQGKQHQTEAHKAGEEPHVLRPVSRSLVDTPSTSLAAPR